MMWAAVVALCIALTAWALVVLDLGRRLIAHADGVEERRRLALQALDAGALERRLTKLENIERQTANVLAGRSR